MEGDNNETHITHFDFVGMLFSLLDDKSLNKKENLVVNSDNFFSKYNSPGGRLGELNSGAWYERAYKKMILDPKSDFLCPIILYMDKTQLAGNAKISIFPVMMTLSIFNVAVSSYIL